ncbi:AraC family transcriptional regulator [Pseudodesulfovibrio sp. zrk46]|uniref:AraC family transcriptional regulator n=1 Tax=Pseudodesulfovibrio sp. zrk46 TaxID=2725288 RepID=UPI00144908CB|nr:AraC family transcriptional regulator [Pseudodesulfovibrio sp. zrk46]QJB56798.1 AraC family transcriptional regulator [Pseudodesulfovibrio sp. zrk46]
MPETFQLTQANTLWNLIEYHGHDPRPIFAEEDLTFAVLSDPEVRIAHRRIDNLWQLAADTIDDPCFGLDAGKVWHPSHFHALGYAWLAASSLLEGLDYLQRYRTIFSERGTAYIEQSGQRLRIILSDEVKLPCQMDSSMSLVMKLCRMNYGEGLKPLHVTIAHPAPSCAERFTELFQCHVEFDAEEDCIELSMEDAQRKLKSGNPLLLNLHDEMVKQQLSAIEGTTIIERARKHIRKRLPSGELSADELASAMNISLRSLQREMTEAETTYRELLRSIRQDLAAEYIQDSLMSLTEVAFLLGYADYSAFSRAHKRWTGQSPRELRLAQTAK